MRLCVSLWPKLIWQAQSMLLSLTLPLVRSSPAATLSCVSHNHLSIRRCSPLLQIFPFQFCLRFSCIACVNLSCSYSCSRSSVSLFLPLLSFLYAGHRGCGWSSTTVQGREQKRKGTQWILIYWERGRNSFFPSLSLYCPAGLHIIYAHPQSCSETKG